jgi:tetratricopeptide (TPR) repeat protein
VSSFVSARARAVVITALVAALAAGVVVAIAARAGREPPPQAPATPRPGAPPLALDLGVRTNTEARALRGALGLYSTGKRRQAAAIFSRYDSLEARVGKVVAAWPDGTVSGLSRLATLYPKSALVQLELGLAILWAGDSGASDAWRQAAVLEPDTSYAVAAANLLYPQYAKNLPTFVPDQIDLLDRLGGKSAAAQLRILRRSARRETGVRMIDHLLYGVALQRLDHPLSAQREFDRAAELAPNDPEALVAAAVGRFDKADPSAAFSRLGPLARRFPKSATVRFHLGLLLLWIGSVRQAKKELQLATTVQSGSPLVSVAKRYLALIARAGR